MLLRITTLLFACMVMPAHALDIATAPTESAQTEIQRAGSRTVSEVGMSRPPASSETPIGSYGLALATLALIGFMSRR